MIIQPLKSFNKSLRVASDKSITHRAVMLNSVAEGEARIYNALLGEDCLATIDCMGRLGAVVDMKSDHISVRGTLKLMSSALYVGNSGTTIRLLSGILCGQEDKKFEISGDNSICSRPMNRIITPLTAMGGSIIGSCKFGSCIDGSTTCGGGSIASDRNIDTPGNGENGYAPLTIEGKVLHGIDYTMPVASAQVKSCLLLAGCYASGRTVITEKELSRDHTEKMLISQGANLSRSGNQITIQRSKLAAIDVHVPGDISSAAYFLVLSQVVPNARVTLSEVSVNPTRTGILDVLRQCGANFTIFNQRNSPHGSMEEVADISIEYTADLKPFDIGGDIIPRLIDEIPALAVLGCFIKGRSIIRGAEELKVKESNRIDVMVSALSSCGADISSTIDGMIICGTGSLHGGATIDPHSDHRIAMSMAIAFCGSILGGEVLTDECVRVSYPLYYKHLLE